MLSRRRGGVFGIRLTKIKVVQAQGISRITGTAGVMNCLLHVDIRQVLQAVEGCVEAGSLARLHILASGWRQRVFVAQEGSVSSGR